jgi:regulator of sigma E protease
MSQFFISIVAFIVALGILVAVHEFGHFWVARKLGVKVLRFSIGFGKPIWGIRFRNDPTEYVIAAIPLGGYVKMLDEREGEVAPEERHLAFNNQSVWSRIVIVCAGPAANILLAILVYALVFVIGITGIKPVIGGVNENSFAERAGFSAGEQIVAVGTDKVETWQDARLAILETVIERDTIEIAVIDNNGDSRLKTIDLAGRKLLQDHGDIIDMLGFRLWEPVLEPVIHEVIAGGAADKTGLLSGDRIMSVDGIAVNDWRQWASHVRQRPQQEIVLTILRNEQSLELSIIPASHQTEDGIIGLVGATVAVPTDAYADHRVLVRYNPVVALAKGLQKTWDMTLLTFRMIGKLITGSASPKNISGPITIAEFAGKSASIGLSYFLDLLAIISVSLAVLNILPIPLLDGGHLLYYIVEFIKGSPVSERIQLVGQNIGILILACLMSLAFYNDITRLLG